MTPLTLADAEAEAYAALRSDDPDRIAAAEALIDRLEAEEKARRPVLTLLGAALWYAEQGLPVFPLIPGRKNPLGGCSYCSTTKGGKCAGPQECGHPSCHGLLDATTDPTVIRARWSDNPEANVGIATGHGIDVVDIDGPEGQMSRLRHWGDIFGAVDADNVGKVLTPRPGGMHIYVPATGDASGTNIMPAVDYRGIGGYVVAPPSVIAPGGKDHPGTYRWLGSPRLDTLRTAAA